MKDITHIERSNLPWRTENATECGLDAERHPTWTRDEVQAKEKELGKQRLSLFVCMTCWHTYARHATWEEDPASCMARHCSGMGLSRWGRMLSSDHPERRRFADELRAIAPQTRILRALLEAHPADVDRDELAGMADQSHRSSAYQAHVATLQQLGAVEYPQPGRVRASELLFPARLR